MELKFDNFCFYSTRLLMDDVLGDVYVELSNTKSADGRFLYTRALLRKHKMLGTTLDTGIEYEHPSVSEGFRLRGNEFFKAKMYEEAVDMYTKSLKSCKPNSVCNSLAAANRSAAHFRMGKYNLCLKGLRSAVWSNYPSKLAYKLYERAGNAERKLGRVEKAIESYAECLERLDEADMSAENKRKFRATVETALAECEELLTFQKRSMKTPPVEQLVGGRNENIPALSAFVELKMSENMGRGVYATRDINPGK